MGKLDFKLIENNELHLCKICKKDSTSFQSLKSSTCLCFTLTNMEKKVARELIKDKSNQEIADTLYISKRTVESHITSAIQKLRVKSRVGLAVKTTELLMLNNEYKTS
ncbi:regulatory protein, luxR family [Marininema mesophilum]|uniref:Regulatory protein, luxR family n=1 Tax=Marininema mesophilum TaxID=1048340 RepID=A0A1H2YV75_9BACL|nr:LuxR C-terminal-related transcriptional regulator [Marininema mesophilum]SDX08961.1 regulatory protein, luxR family [Marininema mesophilum]